MGIEVSVAKAVSINDHHENGVDTSVGGNPTRSRFKGISLLHVFSRNQRGQRRDDGNPLVHALKGRRGFTIQPFWKNQIMSRAQAILEKSADALHGYDYVLPMPSGSPFCAEFAERVAGVAGAPILAPDFLRKRTVGEMLAEIEAQPPKMRPGLKKSFASQLHAWENMNPDSLYQAKDVDPQLRPLFNAFALKGDAPDIEGKRILIVDDIFATGSSLASARAIVEAELGASVAAVFFLSGV